MGTQYNNARNCKKYFEQEFNHSQRVLALILRTELFVRKYFQDFHQLTISIKRVNLRSIQDVSRGTYNFHRLIQKSSKKVLRNLGHSVQTQSSFQN